MIQVRIAAAALLAVLAAGCGSGSSGSTGPVAPDTSRCVRPAAAVIRGISTGLEQGLRLRGVQAVRSRDFSRVYFVSADLQGPGLEGTGDVATWATNRVGAVGSIFAAGAVAEEFSDWGSGPGFSVTDEGVAESQDCVAAVLGP